MASTQELNIERVILRHLSGSKAGQHDTFELKQFHELNIGRLPSSQVHYDADRDDLVSGQHARIAQDAADPAVFTLTDLGSRNGTFVNKQRVTSPVRLRPGDVIQFGAGGPEMEFDCDPRPEGLIKSTRMAAGVGGAPIKPTRAQEAVSAPAVAASAGIGKSTFYQVVAGKARETRKQMLYGLAGVLVVLGLVSALLAWKLAPAVAAKCGAGGKCSIREINEKWAAATVKLDVTWKLISPSGGLVYHQYMLNQKPDSEEAYIPGGPRYIPFYVKLDGNTIEPFLTYDGNKFSRPIGGRHSGTGFVVTSQGFILTNRHVAAAWEEDYTFPDDAGIGIVFAADKKTMVGTIRRPPRWIPAKTRQEFGEFKGANDQLEVGFPGSSMPYRAELIRTSERHDVALIKVNMPESAPTVDLLDNYDAIREGEQITVLGYPAVTPPIAGFIRPQDSIGRETETVVIPKVTVTPGNIGAVLRGGEGKDRTVSVIGDLYQLTVNATGHGNSGGPVFDETGRVIGIFVAGRSYGAASVTYAVPTRYGKELLSR
jgi:S1-C subfamily serine protease